MPRAAREVGGEWVTEFLGALARATPPTRETLRGGTEACWPHVAASIVSTGWDTPRLRCELWSLELAGMCAC